MDELLKSEERLRALIENIPDGIISLDRNWMIVYINPIAEALLRREGGSLKGRNLWEVFPEARDSGFYQAYHEALRDQKSRYVEDYSPVLGKWTGATLYPSANGLSVYFHDLSGQKGAENRARESEENYRLFLDRITDGFIALDRDFCYTYVNARACELVRRDPQSLLGKNVWEVFPEAVGSDTYTAFHTAFKEQRFISHIDYFAPLELWQENYIYPSPEGLSVFIKDISYKKKLERELREQERNQQFEIMVTALEAQEKERTHIGQELHDNVNQLLVATRLMLALLRDHPGETGAEIIAVCIENLEKAIEENRRISHELVTPNLKAQSLVEQLDLLARAMLSAHGIAIEMQLDGFTEGLLDEPRKLAVYRIAQEQCTNIVKYAGAGKVVFILKTTAETFTMTIADDGEGMDESVTQTGIGLRNIAGRVAFFDGHFSFYTRRGKGFRLEIGLPLSERKVEVRNKM
jgi:PAS domain S-box-containing protein